MASWHAWIALLLMASFATGCIGGDPVKPAKVTPPVDPTPPRDDTKNASGTPLDVAKSQGHVDGVGTPAFSMDFPTSESVNDIKTKANGSLRFELKFAPGGAAATLHVEVDDRAALDPAGQPKVLGEKDGGPLLVIDLPAEKLAGVKELGYRVFFGSGSAGKDVEFQAAASMFNGTIPSAYTAFR